MNDAVEMVRQFHRHVGAPVSDVSKLLTCNRQHAAILGKHLHTLSETVASLGKGDQLLARLSMELEELGEWVTAHAQTDLVSAADAWADRAYVLFGDAVCCGLPADAIFNAVHKSNMTKESQADLPGKAVKGPGYQRPDITRVLEEHHGR